MEDTKVKAIEDKVDKEDNLTEHIKYPKKYVISRNKIISISSIKRGATLFKTASCFLLLTLIRLQLLQHYY